MEGEGDGDGWGGNSSASALVVERFREAELLWEFLSAPLTAGWGLSLSLFLVEVKMFHFNVFK